MSSNNKIIIDCDAGTDDAQAIMMALSRTVPECQVLGITCVAGNATLDKVCRNVLYILDVCGCSTIPVYRGCPTPLLRDTQPQHDSFHGKDGLGDNLTLPNLDESRLQSKHAAIGLLDIISSHPPNTITLVTLGPLSNISLAQKLDSKFASNLKALYIMGGNVNGRGNMPVNAEFNIQQDPEATKIVFNEFPSRCPTYILPWEICQDNFLSWKWADTWTTRNDTKRATFNSAIIERVNERRKHLRQSPGFFSCDAFCIATALDTSIITSSTKKYVTIELSGEYSRGQTIIDWGNWLHKEPNINVIQSLDRDKLLQMFNDMLID